MKLKILIILCLYGLLTNIGYSQQVSIEAKIQGLYIGYFNRAADKAGLDYWKNRAVTAVNNSTVLKELSAGFANHPSFAATYAHLSNRAFVEAIYRNVLGKEGDSTGINFWTQSLDRGMDRSDVVADFIEASLTADLESLGLTPTELAIAQQRQALITNKTEVAINFTHLLDELSNVKNVSFPENDPAYLASINILTGVDENNSTATEKINFLISLVNSNDPIATINNGGNQDSNEDGNESNNKIPVLSNSDINTYLAAINQARSTQQNCGTKGIFPPAPPLSWSNQLYQSSYEHSYDLANSNTFSHSGSGTISDWTGFALGKQSTYIERIEKYGYSWGYIGENVAAGTFTNTASIVMQQWLDSDGHCANLMNTGYTEVGMAMVRNDNAKYTHYWTQNFATPR